MDNRQAERRRGFTLVELIVVISILSVLITLAVAATAKFIVGAQNSTTRTTLRRLDTMLRKQMETTNDRARKMRIPDEVLMFAGGDPERAKVIWLKLKLKQKYPTTFAEVFNPTPGYAFPGITPVPAYMTYLAQYGINASNAATAQPQRDSTREAVSFLGAESSACLLMALRVGPDAIGEDELAIGGSTAAVKFQVQSPNQQPVQAPVPCLIDAWGTPVTFCRWPTGAAGTGISPLYSNGYASGYTDPLDPKGVLLTDWEDLLSQLPKPPSARPTFERLLHRLPPLQTRPQPGKMLLAPVMISSGNDELLGVNPLTLEQTGTESDDNIFSAELR